MSNVKCQKLNWWVRLELYEVLNIFCDFKQKHETCSLTSEYLHKYKKKYTTSIYKSNRFTRLSSPLKVTLLSS